jgi:cytochrome c-type biogenesis protein CcmH/NrfG
MEFGLPGRDGEEAISIPEEILRRQRGEKPLEEEQPAGNRAIRALVQLGIFLGVLALVGTALSLTNYGFFGMYYLERYLPAAGEPKAVRAAIERAEKVAANDTFEDVRRALAILGRERTRAGINRELLTRSIVHESLYALRFGADPASSARSAAIMSRLEERRFDAPAMELAFAGDLARRNEFAQMAEHLEKARAEAPKDPYVELMAGELALKQEKLADALKAFTRAKELGAGARAEWGVARVALAGSDLDAQEAAVEATLALSPLHVGARIGKARVLVARGQEQAALVRLEQAVGTEPVNEKFLWSSGSEKADGFSVLGYVHEVRGRLHLARKAYADALSGDPFRLEALLGAGRVLLRERRFSDGLTRFESAL